MDFEPALRAELIAIEGLSNKVFPLVAPGGTEVPYVAYTSSEGLKVKSLDGYQGSKKVDVSLNVMASSYANLKPLESAIIDKLITFQSREIGTDGPFIQDFSYEDPVEQYENLTKLYRAIINFTVYFE